MSALPDGSRIEVEKLQQCLEERVGAPVQIHRVKELSGAARGTDAQTQFG